MSEIEGALKVQLKGHLIKVWTVNAETGSYETKEYRSGTFHFVNILKDCFDSAANIDIFPDALVFTFEWNAKTPIIIKHSGPEPLILNDNEFLLYEAMCHLHVIEGIAKQKIY